MHKNEINHKASSLGEQINGAIFYALVSLIVLSPIPFGSNRAWSWSLCALIISFLSLAWIVNTVWNKRTVSLSLSPLIPVLFLVPCIWATLQASTFMPSAWSHPLWVLATDALNILILPSISITPDNGYTALMRLISYGLVFFLVFQFCRNPRRAQSVLKWLAVAGTFYALYGLIVYWGNINVFFWSESADNVNIVTSTFINRNNYAMYAGLGLLCLMALSLSNTGQRAGPRFTSLESRQQRIETYIFSSWKPLLGLMLITTALISTQSRGGSISSAIAVITLLLIVIARKKLKIKMLLVSVGGMCLIILMAFSISNGPLLKRMEQVESGGAERITVFKLTVDATKDNPWAGFGYGSFDQGFKMYRSENVGYVYDKTHNTYLENAFELGIPATSSLFIAMLSLTLLTLRGVFRRHRNWIYPATGLAATSLVASHSLIDFSLQIPAIAITYSAIMGMAVAQSYSSS
ncbi:MAG: O-antigen ligase [Parvicella sp.]|jgi:O-antigen ligase